MPPKNSFSLFKQLARGDSPLPGGAGASVAELLMKRSKHALLASTLANDEAERHLNPVGLAGARTINAPKEE